MPMQAVQRDLTPSPGASRRPLPQAGEVDAIVCSALLDLVSPAWLARMFDGLRVPFLACLTVDGRDVTAEIRTPAVSEAASRAAASPAVREAMVVQQRRLLSHGDWVAEGRDIGTVVAPDAEIRVLGVLVGVLRKC